VKADTDPNPIAAVKRPWLPLMAILILAALLRLYGIGDSCFWLDEFCSVECSTGRGLAHVAIPRDQWLTELPRLTSLQGAPPIWRIWTSMGLDNHPPLYFLLLRGWRELFGESDATARLLSLAISLIGIAFFYDAVKTGLGRRAAIWASLLAAIAMSQIHYGQEARGYTLAGTLGMAACAAIMRLEVLGVNQRRWIGLATATLGMLLTHYFAIAGAAALGLYALIALRGTRRTAVITALLAASIAFVCFWGPQMLEQRKSLAINNSWQKESSDGHAKVTLQRTAVLPVRWFSELAATRVPLVATIVGVAGYAFTAMRFRDRRRLWCLWMILPVLMVAVVDVRNSSKLLDSLRYTLAGSWGLFALVSGSGPKIRYHLLAGAVALLCIASVPFSYSKSQDWSVLGQFLEENVSANDVLVCSSDGWDDWYAGALYLGVSHYAKPLPAPLVLLTKSPSADLLQQMRGRRTIWLIAGSQTPADKLIPGMVVEESAVFPDIGKVWKLHPAQPSTAVSRIYGETRD